MDMDRSQMEISFLDLSCEASLHQPPAIVSELVCKYPSKAGQSAGGGGVQTGRWEAAEKGLLRQKGNGWAEGPCCKDN